ncbi:MAG: DUF2723 domain-containing protein [Patescibacteria group bacterium]
MLYKIRNKFKTIAYSKYVWFFLVFSFTLAVYLFTLCPSIYLEDSAEFVTVIDGLGIPHPSGYPLYVLFGKLFTILVPIGTVAWKVNLMSAFFGALTASFVFLIVRYVVKKNIISVASALIFAFTLTFWSQSVVAEVYTLNTFFVSLIIYLLLVWKDKIKVQNFCFADKLLLFIVFLFGLSLANHQMMILLSPIFVLYVVLVYPKIFKDYKLILAILFLVVLGLSVYLYLPIRAAQNPMFNWGNPQAWSSFKGHVLRQQYNDLIFKSDEIFDKDKLFFVSSFFEDVISQFTFLGLFIILVGFIWQYIKSKKGFFLFFGIALFNSLLIILLRSAKYQPTNDVIFRVYYLQAYLIMAIWFGMGLDYLSQIILKFTKKFSEFFRKIIIILLSLIIIFLPVSFLLSNYQANDRSDFWIVDDWARAVLESLDRDSYLMLDNDQPAFDSMIFSLFCMQAVENIRTDVRLVNLAGIKGIFFSPYGTDLDDFSKWDDKTRKSKLAEFIWNHSNRNDKKSTYILYPLGENPENNLITVSNGLVYKIYENIDKAKAEKINNLVPPALRNLEYASLEYNLFYSDFLSDYYFAQSAFFIENNYLMLAKKNLIKAIKYDASPFSFNYHAFVEWRKNWGLTKL